MSNEHIPTAEIKADIADTWREIQELSREEQGLRICGDRWSIMRADHRKDGIAQRHEFIKKLEAILAAREAASAEGE